ncbi:MAG: hypothetical protein ACW960_00880 [Candidatus Thorarchaeota archaeon]
MKPWLMDILACPLKECRSELQLEVYESHTKQIEDKEFEEIDAALIQNIEEIAFLKRWKERISSEILEKGVPFGLSTED